MKLTSLPLAISIFVLMFGGIGFSTAMNWWQTESTKTPARYTEGEYAGEFNPADIRGSYTFGDINKNFGIPLEDLQIAFRLPSGGNIAAFQVKSLEELYAELPVEMGTGAVRLFTAFYLGLPYDLSTNSDTYLFPEAAAILMAKGSMTPEQAAFISTHILADDPLPVDEPPAAIENAPQQEPVPDVAAPVAVEEAHVPVEGEVTGQTTFQNLLDWGMTTERIDAILGQTMPAASTLVKDFASANGLPFSTLKGQLQAELDNLK